MNSPQNGPKNNAPIPGAEAVLKRYEPVIGLEIHIQLRTKSKLFCSCPNAFGGLPNHHTCPVCLGQPGVLPVLNGTAVDYAIAMALAIGAEIRETSVFARKQYFYPDLPKGYQITQYDLPYCQGGQVTLDEGRQIKVTRIHLEEDAGKNIHSDGDSFVDLNRAGTPLIEMVSEPDLRTPAEAAAYLRRVRAIVRFLDISDGNLEEGSFRCDANVSLRPRGQVELGTRTEIKNLNSFRNVERAITWEILRQADRLDAGEEVVQQTMKFDAATGRTSPTRSKEQTADYRYFPDPDLKPLTIDTDRIARIRAALPELPEAMSRRYQEEFQLTPYDAETLTSDKDLAAYFEEVLAAVGGDVTAKIVANWVSGEFLREANNGEWDLARPPIPAAALGELLGLMGKGTISGKIAKTVFEDMVQTGRKPSEIVKEKGLVQVSDSGAISQALDEVLEASPGQIQQYLAGKEKLLGYFVGQVMKKSGGRFNPGLVNQLLKEKLNERREKS